MSSDRGFALLAAPDQWARCVHDRTVLLPDGGVGLDWTEVPPPSRWSDTDGRCDPPPPRPASACPGGITSDRWCRTWRTRPELGTVEVSRRGEAPHGGCPDGLRRPTGIAVDGRDRVYVIESQAGVVMVGDLWSGRVLRRVPVPGRPVDVVAIGGDERPAALVLTRSPGRVFRIEGATGSCPPPERLRRPCGHHGLHPARVTVVSGRVVVLWRGRRDAVVADLSGNELVAVPHATDVEGSPSGLLVVARRPGETFLRFQERDGVLVEDKPLAAADYDGGAITLNPAGRIVYTTATGSRSTQGPQARHVRTGSVTTYRLDGGAYRTRWGRLFLEACLPTGTSLTVRAITSDEDEVENPVAAAPPGRGNRTVPAPELTPPLPPSEAMDAAPALPVLDLHDDPLGTVGAPLTGAGWASYESGVAAPPGRYLWLRLEMSGTERTSPTVRAIRVERPGHALLSALPRTFSAVDSQADFLHGFLAPAEGVLHDLDVAAADRGRLVDPVTTPSDFLPWLAALAGIVLDLRWPEDARRALLAEVYPLYARRGTAAAIERMLQLYLGRRARVVERWRLRGPGGGFLGLSPVGLDAPSVGGTTRKSVSLGNFTVGGPAKADAYARLAHRFTVLVPGCLTAEQRAVVGDIVGSQKPSHTVGDICELGDGLPVGRLRLGLTAFVGPRAALSPSPLGGARLGVGSTLGTAEPGSRLGETRLGGVRVG
ncbi:MAG: phage tail protein [Micropruina sp.]